MSNEYWKSRKKWDQIHGRGEYAPKAEPKLPPAPPSPDPLAEARRRIVQLEDTLSQQWEVYANCFGGDTDERTRREALDAMTRRLERLGITLPDHPAKK